MSRSAFAIAKLAASPSDTDAELVRAFLDCRAENAFAELVRRHGPMVLATSRRVFSNAADAFQRPSRSSANRAT